MKPERVAAVLVTYHAWLQENGWQIVPKEPTPDMISGGAHEQSDCETPGGCFWHLEQAYRAMLAAAPKLESDRRDG